MDTNNIYNFIPGFTMGMTRAIISHPFEMMKIKSQINQTEKFYKNLFKGLHYSVLTNSLERGMQFGLYEKFKLNDGNLNSSIKASLISTSLTLPYNIVLLRTVIMQSTINIPKKIFYKSAFLEYSRNLSGSILFLLSYNYMKDKDCPIVIRAPLSSCFVWSLTYPIDTYKNILISNNCVNINLKNLYKGIQYPFIRSIPSSIIGFYVYEYMLTIKYY